MYRKTAIEQKYVKDGNVFVSLYMYCHLLHQKIFVSDYIVLANTQRCNNVISTSWRHGDVETTFLRRFVFTEIVSIRLNASCTSEFASESVLGWTEGQTACKCTT